MLGGSERNIDRINELARDIWRDRAWIERQREGGRPREREREGHT